MSNLSVKTIGQVSDVLIEHMSHRMKVQGVAGMMSRREAVKRVAEAIVRAMSERRYHEAKRILVDYFIDDGCLEAGHWSLETLFAEFNADHHIYDGSYIELSDEDKADIGLSYEGFEDDEDWFDPYVDYVRSEVSFLNNQNNRRSVGR